MEQAGAYRDRRSRLERDNGNKNPWPTFLETVKTQGKVSGSRFIFQMRDTFLVARFSTGIHRGMWVK